MKSYYAKLTFCILTFCTALLATTLGLYHFHLNLKTFIKSTKPAKPEVEKIKLPRKSFLFIEKNIEFKVCNKLKKKKRKVKCFTIGGTSSASSFAIHTEDNGSYILTAAHVCKDTKKEIVHAFADMLEENGLTKRVKKNSKVEYTIKLTLVDLELNSFAPIVINVNHKVDSCLLFIPDVILPIISPASEPPELGEIIYTMSSPAGVFGNNLVPAFKGIYNGTKFESKLLGFLTDVYSLPVTGGSSGAPILNRNNEFVGVTVAAHDDFKYIAYSPRMRDLYQYLSDALIKYPSCEETQNVKRSKI